MDKSKPFGLIIPKKATSFPGKKSAIFDSDSDDESKKKTPKIPQKPISKKLIEAEKVEDPTIYEYDAIYDDMKAQEKAKLAAPKTTNKPSRYIDSLLKAADKRKKTLERRLEKKVQAEREKEGDKFKDKESFVTSTYKKKMQEREEEEERERRENELNDMMDVTKQKDLSGFYRHFLKQSIGEEKVPVFGERSIKKEPESIKEEPESPKSQVNEVEGDKADLNIDRDSDISLSSSDDEESKHSSDAQKPQNEDCETNEEPRTKKRKIHRQIRKRFDEGSEEEEIEKKEKEREKKKVTEIKNNRGSSENSGKYKADAKKRKSSIESSDSSSNSEDETEKSELNDVENAEKHTNKDSESNGDSKKERKNIYEKRTVGTVFTDAQVRYFQRMNSRNS